MLPDPEAPVGWLTIRLEMYKCLLNESKQKRQVIRETAQLIKDFLGTQEDLAWIPGTHAKGKKKSSMVFSSNSSTGEDTDGFPGLTLWLVFEL